MLHDLTRDQLARSEQRDAGGITHDRISADLSLAFLDRPFSLGGVKRIAGRQDLCGRNVC